MDSQSAPVVSAAKLPILNPNEFDLWKMRIEQYFLMIYYSLWDVIINGDSVISRVAVDGVTQPVTVLNAEQKLARKTELKARGTLLMALPDKHQLKFNSHKDAKTLIEAMEKRFRGNTKTKKMAMLTMRARRFLQKTGRNLGDNRVTTMGFDMSKVECYNCHRKGHFTRECRSPKDTRRTGGAEPHKRTNPENIIVLKNEVEARDNFILTLKQKLKQAETEMDDLKLKFEKFQSSSKSLTELIASQTNNKHGLGYLSLEDDSESVSLTCPSDRLSPSGRYHVSLAKPAQAMSHTTESMAPIIEDWVSDSEDESESNDPQSVFVQPIETSAAVPKIMKSRPRPAHPINRKSNPSIRRWPPRVTLGRLLPHARGLGLKPRREGFPSGAKKEWGLSPKAKVSPAKPAQAMSHTTESMAPIIEDWVSDSEDESESNDPRSVSVQPIVVPILDATPKPTIKTSSSGKRKNRKTCFVCRSADHLIKDCNFYVKPQTTPTPRNSAHRGCNKQYASFTKKYPKKYKVPVAVLPKSKPVSVTAIRQVSVVVPKIMKSRPNYAHTIVTRSKSTIRRHKTRSHFSKTSNSSSRVTAAQAPMLKLMLLVYMVTTTEVNREVTTDN
nr:ribonuclease H-like domain-containing protein [Tanacetum cinerariifolium]